MNKLLSYAGKYKYKTYMAVLEILAAVLCSIVPYIFVYQLITPLVSHQNISGSFAIPKILGILLFEALYLVLYALGLRTSHEGAYHILHNLRVRLQRKYESLSLGKIQDFGTGQTKRMFVDDIEGMELLLAHGIPEGLGNALATITIIIAMFVVDWRLALLGIAVIPISFIVMGAMFSSSMKKMNEYYGAGSKMNNTIIEYVNGMEVVKVFNKETDSFKKYKDDITAYRDFTIGWYKICWPYMAVFYTFLPTLAIFVLPIGGYFVTTGLCQLPNLILVICLCVACGTPLLKVSNQISALPQIGYKLDNLEKLLDNEELKAGTESFTGSNHDVSFENVSFSYKEEEVIHKLNLKCRQNTVTALVGESGSGKSTLAKLLVHFYDLDSGAITIGGQDITKMSIESVNNLISYVAQEQFLFNTSLYDNILIGKLDATKEEVLEAARKAQCMDFIEKLPDGIYSKAGDSGKLLSGGERQRISLARAILKNAPVIVLDEATAFIDPENEEKMNMALNEIMKDKTVLVIAHRLETIKDADNIVVMDNGNILDQGKHEELMVRCPKYNALWNAVLKEKNWQIKEEEMQNV